MVIIFQRYGSLTMHLVISSPQSLVMLCLKYQGCQYNDSSMPVSPARIDVIVTDPTVACQIQQVSWLWSCQTLWSLFRVPNCNQSHVIVTSYWIIEYTIYLLLNYKHLSTCATCNTFTCLMESVSKLLTFTPERLCHDQSSHTWSSAHTQTGSLSSENGKWCM
jgi:hypothetical protein